MNKELIGTLLFVALILFIIIMLQPAIEPLKEPALNEVVFKKLLRHHGLDAQVSVVVIEGKKMTFIRKKRNTFLPVQRTFSEMNKIYLSVDADFFSRELPEWDWGHNEHDSIFNNVAWLARYIKHRSSKFDIFKETGMDHADVYPNVLFRQLKKLGFKFNKNTVVGTGWSHSFAYEFGKTFDFDILINIDAHHDYWYRNFKEFACDNWIPLLRKDTDFDYYWVCPSWIIHTKKVKDVKRIDFTSMGDLASEVTGIYIAQSPAWLPPHHDIQYLSLVEQILKQTKKTKPNFDKGYVPRTDLLDEILKQRRDFKKKQIFAAL